jgi:hypothetical protein
MMARKQREREEEEWPGPKIPSKAMPFDQRPHLLKVLPQTGDTGP